MILIGGIGAGVLEMPWMQIQKYSAFSKNIFADFQLSFTIRLLLQVGPYLIDEWFPANSFFVTHLFGMQKFILS